MSSSGSNKAASQGSATRAAAAAIVDRVLRQGRSLEQLLPEIDPEIYSAADRSFIRALVFGTLRFQVRHEALLKKLLSKPVKKKDKVLEALMSVGLYQLLESGNPDYAVVSATVDATKDLQRPHARGLVNAVLRRFLRERGELLAAIEKNEAAKFAMPDWMLQRLKSDWPGLWRDIAVASNCQAPMWLRVNRQLFTPAEYQAKLQEAGISADYPDDSSEHESLCLAAPVPVDTLPEFYEGACSVQDRAAQYAARLLNVQPGERVLDACAAPGGKTCHIAELQPALDALLAIDNSSDRLQRVTDNLSRLGLAASVVTGDALQPDDWWDGQLFDCILLDAPCSASGVIRRHPDIKHLRQSADIEKLSHLQGHILDALWSLLKPGGRLLYATCSVFRAENQDVVQSFLERQTAATLADMPLLSGNEAVSNGPGIQLFPGAKANTDGFYYALMRNSQV